MEMVEFARGVGKIRAVNFPRKRSLLWDEFAERGGGHARRAAGKSWSSPMAASTSFTLAT